MKKEVINAEIQVNDNKIKVITLDSKGFISLTDLRCNSLFRIVGKIE